MLLLLDASLYCFFQFPAGLSLDKHSGTADRDVDHYRYAL